MQDPKRRLLKPSSLCLKAGADVNAVDSRGQTRADRRRRKKALRQSDPVSWHDHGAKVDLKDKQGKTALDAALGNAGGGGGFRRQPQRRPRRHRHFAAAVDGRQRRQRLGAVSEQGAAEAIPERGWTRCRYDDVGTSRALARP